MNKNVLITGGAGFIGSNMALKLIDKGYTVTILDNLSPQIHGNNPKLTSPLYKSIVGKTRFVNGSVTSIEEWKEALRDQSIVIHLAAETGTGQSMYEIRKYADVNIGGTAILLDILANQKHIVEKIIIASSRSIYGEGKYRSEDCGVVYPKHRDKDQMEQGKFDVQYPGCNLPLTLLPTDEESKIHPSSVYGITKQNQEQMIMTVCPTLGIAPVALRYQNVYGPGQSLSNPYTGILSIFSTQIRNGNAINIFEDGKESRDFVYIDDVVTATMLGVEKDAANGQIFNVGYGKPVNVLTVAETLIRCYGIDVPVHITGNYRLGDIRHNYADLSKINKVLGFVPVYNFEKGVKEFANWVLQQEIMEDRYAQSIKEMEMRGLYK
jgi:dTDP-L-rhamnose 4-epimerase